MKRHFRKPTARTAARALALALAVMTVLPLLSGCGKKSIQPTGYKTPKDFSPTALTDENNLPDDTYFIRHKKKNGSYVYYPLLNAENTFDGQPQESKAGFDPSRIVWVNYNQDEGLIPTMHKNDDLIYKSTSKIPNKYALEKFFDDGYTVGVAGLKKDTSGNYAYISAQENSGTGHVMSTSDAAGFEGLSADSIYFNKIGTKRVDDSNVSSSGTITGLKLMKAYPADIRTGTEKIEAVLTCNIHLFTSAETYMFGEFRFLTPVTAKLLFPDYAKSGYYTIGGKAFFRYIDNDSKSNKLSEEDANGTIYTYRQDDQTLVGTSVGLTWDENDFLVKETLSDESNVTGDEEQGMSYDDLIKTAGKAKESSDGSESDADKSDVSKAASQAASDLNESITKKTSLKPTSDGYYIGTYTIDSIEEPIQTENVYTYKLVASNEKDKQLNFVYYRSASDPEIFKGKTYEFIFSPDPNGYDAYAIATAEESGASDGN